MKITNAMPGKVCAILLVVGLVLTGCGTVRIEDYRRRAMDEQRYRGRNNHLEIAATPILDEVDLSKYFGANLLDAGILPIFIRVKNVDPSNSYIFGKEDFSVYEGSNQSGATSDAKVDSNANAPAAAATALLVPALFFTPAAGLLLGAMLAAGKMISDASVVEHNMTDKQFLTTTLAPGQEGSGFLYFKLPQKTSKPATWNIRVNARNPNNSEIVFMELRMNLEQQKEDRL